MGTRQSALSEKPLRAALGRLRFHAVEDDGRWSLCGVLIGDALLHEKPWPGDEQDWPNCATCTRLAEARS